MLQQQQPQHQHYTALVIYKIAMSREKFLTIQKIAYVSHRLASREWGGGQRRTQKNLFGFLNVNFFVNSLPCTCYKHTHTHGVCD